MTHISEPSIRVELKYCELCGGLFFRPADHRLCLSCTDRPNFLLRHLDTPPPEPWYGPMTATVQRLDAVAWSAGASPATKTCEFAKQALPATCSVSQPLPIENELVNAARVLAQDFSPGFPSSAPPESRRDGWTSGGAA